MNQYLLECPYCYKVYNKQSKKANQNYLAFHIYKKHTDQAWKKPKQKKERILNEIEAAELLRHEVSIT